MKTSKRYSVYQWLIQLLSKSDGYTLEEIQGQWNNNGLSDGVELTRYSLIRYRREIADSFGIDIECDKRTNKYYISNPEALRDNSIQRWILSTLAVRNVLEKGLSVQDRIILEDIPVFQDTLTIVLEGLKQNRCLTFHYKKYGCQQSEERIIRPCCLRLFRQRWYVIAYIPPTEQNTSIQYKPYAFDRISNIRLTHQHFDLPRDFHAKDIFNDVFGIFLGDGTSREHIIIRAYGQERNYLESLPLHQSQEIVCETEEYTDFSLFTRPSYDFKSELLSRGNHIEVLSPQKLRDEIAEEHRQAVRRYNV